jgi:alkyl hydroperoxide reductase subunit AhpC
MLNILNANDLQVVDENAIREPQGSDWPPNKHKLLLFYPQTFTPVCQSELGALNKWLPAFAELGCQVIAACTDSAEAIKDWYEHEPQLNDLECLTFSSYLLPARLGLVQDGRAKRSSIFVMSNGEIVKQEHFSKVGRSLAELHRMLYGFTTGSYCASSWQSPADGFLQDSKQS